MLARKSARFGLSVVLPAILAVAGTVAIVVFSLTFMAGDVDRIEDSVTRRAVEAAIEQQRQRLLLAHSDYLSFGASFGGAASALAPLAVANAFSGATKNSEFYDTAYLLDATGNQLLAFRDGVAFNTPASEEYGPALQELIRRLSATPLSSDYPQGGILETRNGLAIVAVGFARGGALIPGRKILILSQRFNREAARYLGYRSVIPSLRLASPEAFEEGGVALRDPLGKRVGTLQWTAPGSGVAALRSVAPVVAAMLLVLAIMVGALIVFAWRSITQIEAGELQTQRAIRQDTLTGLPNRFAARERLNAMLAESQITGRPVATMLLDLDGFKQVNDVYGHVTGDRLLRYVSERLKAFAGDAAWLSRSGGDEFALWAFDDGSVLRQVSERLIELLSKPLNIDGRVVVVGASIGLAVCQDTDMSREELLRRAELAMYQAKEEGGNRLAVYHSAMDKTLHERLEIADELRDSIMAGELDVVYQPVFDAANRTVVNAEALVRWHRKGRGDIPPDVFVPIAEHHGLIGALGAAVLRRACRDAQRWPYIAISVNVSAAQLRDPMFERLLGDILEETGLDPQRLTLEITETYLVSDPVRAKRAIDAVRAMGISVALDDFGTGFSSIGYLRQFTFDHLKLDRSVVADVSRNEPARKLIQATVALADALGLSVTAEGVETEDDAIILRLAGCRCLQGFLFSRPISASALTTLLGTASGAREAMIA
jgi:diguanylate cyclase (GGDEF)-like protein